MPVPCAGGGGGGGAARGRAEFITSLFTGRRTSAGGGGHPCERYNPINQTLPPPPFPPLALSFYPVPSNLHGLVGRTHRMQRF